jgi:uncharacterized protein (TIGR03435 family)
VRKVVVYLAFACLAVGQEFEVASVKPNKSGASNSRIRSDEGRVTATNVTLRSLVVMAYGIKDYQLEAPAWLSEERYDISAKFPEAPAVNQKLYDPDLDAMLRKLLADRFKLQTHSSSKQFEVYGLVIAKSGLKIKEVPDSGSHDSNSANNRYTGTCVPMSQFAEFLARRVDLPVLDMTGLKGYYDIAFDWVGEPRQPSEPSATPEAPAGPTLAMAIEEKLGLKLEMRKAPLDIVIVDRVERIPTEN